jgi:hypothetical protein
MVEYNLAKVVVEGSIPFTCFKKQSGLAYYLLLEPIKGGTVDNTGYPIL